jgi:hypothetical protein
MMKAMLKRFLFCLAFLPLVLCAPARAQSTSPDTSKWLTEASDLLAAMIPGAEPVLTNQSQVEIQGRSVLEALAMVQSPHYANAPGSKITVKVLLDGTEADAVARYGYMFEPFELEGYYLRKIQFAAADDASESNLSGDGTTTISWRSGTVFVEVQSLLGAQNLALRVHRAMKDLGLYAIVSIPSKTVVAEIVGMVTAVNEGAIKLEFEIHPAAEPRLGDSVTFSKLVQGIVVHSGRGEVSNVGQGFVQVKVLSGHPELMHLGNIAATGSLETNDPLAIAKAFLTLLFAEDSEQIGRYINPAERDAALSMLRAQTAPDYRGHKIEQYEFGDIKISSDRATIIAKSPGVPEMEPIGAMVRVDGRWYITFGLDKKPVVAKHQIKDVEGNWIATIPEDWIEGSDESGDWRLYYPVGLDQYQVQFRMRKFSEGQESGSLEDLRDQMPSAEKFALRVEDGPRYANLAGYSETLFIHVTGLNLVMDMNIPDSDKRWHVLAYEVTTEHGTYACLAVCREDYYAEYQQTLDDIFSAIAFR